MKAAELLINDINQVPQMEDDVYELLPSYFQYDVVDKVKYETEVAKFLQTYALISPLFKKLLELYFSFISETVELLIKSYGIRWFKELRGKSLRQYLNHIQKHVGPIALQNAEDPFSFKDTEFSLLESAFKSDFRDPLNVLSKLDDHLVKHVSKWHERYFGPYTSIVNGSMTGKSRLAMELKCRRFVVYSCFRRGESSGYPKRSPCASMFKIDENRAVWGEKFCFYKCIAFLTGILLRFSTFLEGLDETSLSDSLENWSAIQKFGSDQRFWNDVRNLGESFVKAKFGVDFGNDQESFGLNHDTQEIKDQLRNLYDEIHAKLVSLWGDNSSLAKDLGLVIIVDECRYFIDEKIRGSVRSYFDYFKMALSALPSSLSSFKAMTVFIDTIPSVSVLTEEISDPSFRFSMRTKVIEPFFATNFWDLAVYTTENSQDGFISTDISAINMYLSQEGLNDSIVTTTEPEPQAEPIEEGVFEKSENIAKPTTEPVEVLESLFQGEKGGILNLQMNYGRIAWSAMLSSKFQFADLCSIAMSKILGGRTSMSSDPKFAHLQYLAVLNCRLCLPVIPSSKLAVNLVSNFSSNCINISVLEDSDTALVNQLYCADPMLKEGAAIAMNREDFNLKSAIQALENSMERGMVSEGFRGELVAKLLLLLGIDKALNENNGGDGKFSRFVKLSVFLAGMFTSKVLETLESLAQAEQKHYNTRSKPQKPRISSYSILMKGIVFFNSFHYCDYTPTRNDLYRFFARGLAIICRVNQSAVDLIIPLLVLIEGRFEISYVLIQVKNRIGIDQDLKTAETIVTPKEAKIVQNDKSCPPYLSIWMSLNSKEADAKAIRSRYDPNQFLVSVIGISESIYNCVDSEIAFLLRQMLMNVLPIEKMKEQTFVKLVTAPLSKISEATGKRKNVDSTSNPKGKKAHLIPEPEEAIVNQSRTKGKEVANEPQTSVKETQVKAKGKM